MSKSDVKELVKALSERWPRTRSEKVQRYVGQFFDATRLGTKVSARVKGNHGNYTVSIDVDDQGTSSACSCYIGKYGNCHHCYALALTFIDDSNAFVELRTRALHETECLSELVEYLRGETLDVLMERLRSHGITQKAFAEAIGMSSRQLSVIKSSERSNRHHRELGATKLACLWVLEHFGKSESK